MNTDFKTVDLSSLYNANTDNIETADGHVWPYRGDDPANTLLKGLPQGDELFWGIPFQVSHRDDDGSSACFVEIRKGKSSTVSIPIGARAKRILIAHVCASTDGGTTLDGAGDELGLATVTLEGGTTHTFPLRRRFEIHDVSVPWGHHPLLCRNCREFKSVPLDEKSIAWGQAQVGTVKDSNDTGGWWIFDWVNPDPEASIQTLEYTAATETPILIGAITLSNEDGDPMLWPPREEVAVTVEGDAVSPLTVETERAVLARQDRLFIPRDDFLTTDDTGWGVASRRHRSQRRRRRQ